MTRGHTALRRGRDACPAPSPAGSPSAGSGTARDGSSSSSICFAVCLLPQPHVFNSTGRSLALADQNKTAFPRTDPGGGREEERSRGSPLSASPGEDEPGCRLQVSQPRMPRGALVLQGCKGESPAAAPVGQQALRDGGSPGDTGQGVRYRPRAGAAKPVCCSGSPTGAAERSASPPPPLHRKAALPGQLRTGLIPQLNTRTPRCVL